ncbi:MAG: VOC family protein [Chitinophagaceae bacterium]|nr:VOC family protein [Chitinophagaceae bacterium]
MILRVARHTSDLQRIIQFYTEILQLKVLGGFNGHEGYDGVFLGMEGLPWHLEFTSSAEKADHRFDEDDLLVFYPTTQQEFERILNSVVANQVEVVKPKNPYWVSNGVLIKDPDGHGVIISGLQVGGGGH